MLVLVDNNRSWSRSDNKHTLWSEACIPLSNREALNMINEMCLWYAWTPHLFWQDLICLQILLLPYLSALLYPSIPRYQNSFHHCHFHCSLQAWLLQLSLSQPPQVSDHPAVTDRELSCMCCCQSSQIQSHHSHPTVSALAKIAERIEYNFLSLIYKVLTTTQPSYLRNPITVQRPRSTLHLWSYSLVHLRHLLYE